MIEAVYSNLRGAGCYSMWLLGSVWAPRPHVALSIIATRDEHAVPPEESARPAYPLEHLPTIIWLIGVSIGLFGLFTGLARLARVASASQPMPDGRWTWLAATISHEYGLRRRVRLLQSQNSSILVTWGVLRPELILPAGAFGWPEERVAIVLRHELAHIRRLDWIVQLTAQVLRIMYWFNPLLWIVCRRLRLESEYACDDAALSSGVAGPDYAAHLLDLAQVLNKPDQAWSAVLMARPSTVERRFTAMLNPALDRAPLTRRAVISTTVALVAVALPVVAFHSAQNAPVTLSGSVYDTSGAVLPQVDLTFEDVQHAKWQAITDATGRFEFTPVGPGRYVLEAALPGFRPLRHEFELRQASDWNKAITLQVGGLEETVRVTARRALQGQQSSRQATTTPLRIGGNIRVPVKVNDVAPIYPETMRDVGYEGVVPMEALIGRDGAVLSVRVLSAQVHPEFVMAAVDAVRQWRFRPTLLNGERVEVVMTVSVRFSLAD
jgi:TonB family protein